MKDNAPRFVQLKQKDSIKQEKLQRRSRGLGHRQRGAAEGENKSMVSRGSVGAIDDLFRESPLRSLGPRYTFIYRRYL